VITNLQIIMIMCPAIVFSAYLKSANEKILHLPTLGPVLFLKFLKY
jgi:hypothetical protein